MRRGKLLANQPRDVVAQADRPRSGEVHMPLTRMLTVALAAQIGLAGCGADTVGPPPLPATLLVRATVAAAAVATVVVEVSAADITQPLVFNLPVANGEASGALTVPAGSNRAITVRAYDAAGIETHSGATIVNVQSGVTLQLLLTLAPLSGTIDIEITLGHVTITVSPPSGGVTAGGTLQLAATVTDHNGAPVAAVVMWATATPAVATVNGSGLVTGVAPGQVPIVATFGGAAGQAIVTVTTP
jgi:hypothetical protein